MARPQHISDDTLIEALSAAREVTADDLARRLGMGQSTAAKRLAALEADGSARRQPGGRVNGVRVADRWSAATPTGRPGADQSPAGAVTPDADGGDSDGSDQEPTTQPKVTPPETEAAPGREGEEAGSGGAGERLGRGALGTLVHDYLADRPTEDLGPTQVGKALGRSQGAVANALSRLEAAGEARLVSSSPRRYRIITDRR